MDVVAKKPESSGMTNSVKIVKNFTGDIKGELKKISWTSPEELRLYTQLVVGATFILGLGLYLVDLLIQSVLGGFSFIVRLLA